MSLSLQGAFTALVTPFLADSGEVDLAAFDGLCERQIAGGIAGLVPCGTTGESPTLTDDEQALLIERAVAISRGRVPVIAGTGSFSTKKTIESSKRAFEKGADAVMVVMPYYSKPSQEGLFQHVTTVAKAVSGPIVLYNVPGRTQSDLAVETTVRVCEAAPNVIATKEATGNVLRAQELSRVLGDRLTVLSGDDSLTLAMMAVGATGVISVTSNIYPDRVSDVVRFATDRRGADALRAHQRLLPVHDAMFADSNPGPVKAVLAAKGYMARHTRLPLVPPPSAIVDRVLAVVRTYEAAL
jgi:4-hydroxy-tetrahydrodipicolinate synthase